MAAIAQNFRAVTLAAIGLALPACDRPAEKAALQSPKAEPALVVPGTALNADNVKVFEVHNKTTLGGMLGINFTSAANGLKSPCAYGFVVKLAGLNAKTVTETLNTGRANLKPGDKVVVFPDCMAVVEKLGNSRTLNSSDYSEVMGALVERREQTYLALGECAQQNLEAKAAKLAEEKLFDDFRIVTVKTNQTLSEIAAKILKQKNSRFNNSSDRIAVTDRLADTIMAYNNIKKPEDLKAGQKILVPIPEELNVKEFLTSLSDGVLRGIRANNNR